MTLPPEVSNAIETYLSAIDQAAPGLVEGLYVAGSLALDDYQSGISDIDMVAVISHQPSEANSTRSPRSTARVIRASTSST